MYIRAQQKNKLIEREWKSVPNFLDSAKGNPTDPVFSSIVLSLDYKQHGKDISWNEIDLHNRKLYTVYDVYCWFNSEKDKT